MALESEPWEDHRRAHLSHPFWHWRREQSHIEAVSRHVRETATQRQREAAALLEASRALLAEPDDETAPRPSAPCRRLSSGPS